jgi:Flp pilus assembly protein TadB
MMEAIYSGSKKKNFFCVFLVLLVMVLCVMFLVLGKGIFFYYAVLYCPLVGMLFLSTDEDKEILKF